MFAVRRIFRNNKQLSNYICTSSVLQSDRDKKMTNLFRRVRRTKRDRGTEPTDIKINLSDLITDLRPPKKEIIDKNSPFGKAMVSSVEKVAKEVGGDEEQTKRDLLEYVKMLDAAKDPETASDKLERKIKPSSIDRTHKAKQTRREAHDRDGALERRRTQRLGLFKKNIMNKENEVKLKIWDSLKEEHLAAKSKRSPENYFEELINWTNEGRLWKFPIDNDQGMEVEAATSFTEHVFLEKHLEPWCPKKGPLRKFMEMVLIGLGKNPYLTAKEKRAHIMWFKFYFDEKKKLLQELGAMGPTKLEVSSPKSTS